MLILQLISFVLFPLLVIGVIAVVIASVRDNKKAKTFSSSVKATSIISDMEVFTSPDETSTVLTKKTSTIPYSGYLTFTGQRHALRNATRVQVLAPKEQAEYDAGYMIGAQLKGNIDVRYSNPYEGDEAATAAYNLGYNEPKENNLYSRYMTENEPQYAVKL